MSCTRGWTAALAAALVVSLAVPIEAQLKEAPARAGMLVPTAAPAAAQEFRAAFDGYHMWAFAPAVDHAKKALAAAPDFGLARAYLAYVVAVPNRAAELDRAATDAAKGSAAEAVLALAMRERAAGRAQNAAKLFDAAVELAPNDPAVAVERALNLSGSARIDALREISKKYVDDAASRMWLAYYLTEKATGWSRTDAAEALEAAQAALRIAPNEPGAVSAVAHALERVGRHDEALTYLDRSTEATPPDLYGLILRGETLWREGRTAEARESFEKAAAVTPFPTNPLIFKRTQAMITAYEGKPKEALQQLLDVASQAASAGQKGPEALAHITAALVAGGMRDAASAEKEIAAARALGLAGDWVDQDEVLAMAWAGRPTQARQAYGALVKSLTKTGLDRENTLRVFNGIILVAEDKAADAIPELKALPDNNAAQMALVEAYRKLGKKSEANLVRKTLLERKDFPYDAGVIPIAHFRLK